GGAGAGPVGDATVSGVGSSNPGAAEENTVSGRDGPALSKPCHAPAGVKDAPPSPSGSEPSSCRCRPPPDSTYVHWSAAGWRCTPCTVAASSAARPTMPRGVDQSGQESVPSQPG